jgi:hypothetical protein
MKSSTNNELTVKLLGFLKILREAGIRISQDESITLFKALPFISFSDRTNFRQTLQTTLIKESGDIPVFQKCFDNFFSGKTFESADSSDTNLEKLTQKVDEFLSGADAASFISKKDAVLAGEFKKFLVSGSSGEGFGESLFPVFSGEVSSKSDAENEKIRTEMISRLIHQRIKSRFIGKEITLKENYLLNKNIYQLTPVEIKEMRLVIKRLGQKLKSRVGIKLKKTKKGRLNAPKTIKKSAGTDNIPFHIYFKSKKIDRPQIAVLCDISGSVNQYTRFMLLLTHTIQSLFSKVRTFAFVSNLVEITPLFREMDPEMAVNSIFADTEFKYGWGTNYGFSFKKLVNEYGDSLNKKTTVIVLGDARNNHQDPGIEAFIEIKERCKNIIWLNPEKKHLWDWSDSIASVYKPLCLEMMEINSINDLSSFIEKLFKQ